MKRESLGGRAVIGFRKPAACGLAESFWADPDQEVDVIVRFEPGSGGVFHNPSLSPFAVAPARLALFDAEKRHLGFWPDLRRPIFNRFPWRSRPSDWRFIPAGGYAGTSIRVIAGRRPLLPENRFGPGEPLPPGKYFLQMIYFESFVLPPGPDVTVWELREADREVCRSNILELNVLSERPTPGPEVARPAAHDAHEPSGRASFRNEFAAPRVGKRGFWPEYPLRDGGETAGDSVIRFKQGDFEFARATRAVQGDVLTLDVQLPPDVPWNRKVYNPYFDEQIPPPAEWVIYDADKRCLGTVESCGPPTPRAPSSDRDWHHVGGMAGTTRRLVTGRLPCGDGAVRSGPEDAEFLPPGTYYFQLIYLKRFYSHPGSSLEALHAGDGELFRSNVLELQLVESSGNVALPSPQCPCRKAEGDRRAPPDSASRGRTGKPALGGAFVGAPVLAGRTAELTRKAAESRLRAALGRAIDFEFTETPLNEALAQVSEKSGVSIVVDTAGLDAAGISPSAAASLALSDISLEAALGLLLEPQGLDWTITDGLLLVTTEQQARAHYQARIFSVAKLAQAGSPPEEVRLAVLAAVEPETWTRPEDPAAVHVLPDDRLLAVHNRRTLQRIERVLAELTELLVEGKRPQPPLAEARILHELQQLSQVDFYETPLPDCLEYLQDLHEIPIVVPGGLQRGGVGDPPVTLSLTGINLQTALNAALSPLGLEAAADNGVLAILPQAQAALKVQTRVYDVGRHRDAGLTPEDVSSVVARMLLVDSSAGWGTARLATALIVAAPASKHAQVDALLRDMLRIQAVEGGVPLEAPSQQSRLRLAAALKREVAVGFHDKPLQEIVAALQQSHEIPFVIDDAALAKEYVSRYTESSLTHADLPLDSALNLLLRRHNLQWMIDGEVVRITTPAQAAATGTVHVYNVSDLVRMPLEPHDLTRIVRESIDPDGWDKPPVNAALAALGNLVIVRQTPLNHRRIGMLFNELRQPSESRPPQ